MTQTFSMAFTAKCAECSVCEPSTACNLSSSFLCSLQRVSFSSLFFPYIVAAGVSLKALLLDLFTETFLYIIHHLSHVVAHMCAHTLYQCCVSVDSSRTRHCSSEVSIGGQLTNKAGVHANRGTEQALTVDPTPPQPFSLCICAGVKLVSQRKSI